MSDTTDPFTLPVTLRAGYGEPPRDLAVIVGDEIWCFYGGEWGIGYYWGFEARRFNPLTPWVEVPAPIMPIPRHVWAEIGGRRWAAAFGLLVSPDAPLVKPAKGGWRSPTQRELRTLAALDTTSCNKPYPPNTRFGRWYADILRAGDRHTATGRYPDSPPACVVWRNNQVIAVVMPVHPNDTDNPTLHEIVRQEQE